jgi:DNA-binding GntR family transcriptional regulator
MSDNFSSNIPKWKVFYEALREKIIKGEIKADNHSAYLKLKNQLNLNLSQEQEQEAINYLIAEGLIQFQKNKLAFTPPPARSRRDTGFLEDHKSDSRQPSIRTITLEVLTVAQISDLAKRYISNNDELWIHHYHIQLIDNIPYALADSYIPHRLFRNLIPALSHTSIDLYSLMSEAGYPPTSKEERLYIDMPTLPEREDLQILEKMRIQVVRLDSRVWSEKTLVEVCLLCDRADLYEFNYRVAIHL